MFELTPRRIANDLHDDLDVLLTIIHAMDCISFSNTQRGEAANNLDHEATAYLAMWGNNRIHEMGRRIEQLRRSIEIQETPDA